MWHCRHFAWNIVIGHKTPNYTEAQLEELKNKNADGIEIKGKLGKPVKKSMYWCTQKRNEYELQLRKLKEGQAAAEQAMDSELANKYKTKVSNTQQEYIYFCNKCGLKTRFENTRIFV